MNKTSPEGGRGAERRIVLRGGTVVDGSGSEPRKADVAINGARITAVGKIDEEVNDSVFDCSGRFLLPGSIDAHSHADGMLFDPEVAESLLRQGVTTVIGGQDGVSFAPGDGTYASEYFAAINGSHPTYRGGGVGALLHSYDQTTPLNLGYLVPHGTVRYEVMGYASRPASPDEMRKIAKHAEIGLSEGALGVSTGLDYAPGYFANVPELVEFARAAASADALYVTHMRGGYETNSEAGIQEVREIAQATGVSTHISHFHAPAALVATLVEDACAAGADMSYDAYPYRRGCSLLAMPMLPPDLLKLGTAAAARQLENPETRQQIKRDWIPVMESRPDVGTQWATGITIAYAAASTYSWAEGLTLAEAATRAGEDAAEFGMKMMAASNLAVSMVFMVPSQRPLEDIAALLTHRCHLGSSDGIFMGGHPHPRARGSFARFLSLYTKDRGDYSWPQAAVHLSAHTAARHCLGDRGKIEVGYAADIAVIDPTRVSDNASYETPKQMASGIDDVFVNGVAVLHDGRLTGEQSGRGLRRNAKVQKLAKPSL